MTIIISNGICTNFLTGHQGKAEIFEDGIHLCPPEFHPKNIFGFVLGMHIYKLVSFSGGVCTGATDGTKLRNGTLFSPDVSVWTKERLFSRETAQHLYRDGTAPKMVMECEWYHERNMPKKAVDEVLTYYFSDDYIGLDDIRGRPTRVEEAWVYITHPDREVVLKGHRYRMKCWWCYIPIVNEILITIVNLFVGIVYYSAEESTAPTGSMWKFLWTLQAALARYLCWVILDVVPERPAPSTDPLVPYIAIYFRHDKSRATFYHLYPDQLFIAPSNSTLSMMEHCASTAYYPCSR